MSVADAGRQLKTTMWKTRGSRFAARERLRRTNILSVTTITLLSSYVIISSVVLVSFSGQLLPLNEKWLNIINIGLSVLVIVFSLIEFSRDYLGWSEAMNQSALKVGEIYSELSVRVDSGALTQDELNEFERRYSEVLSMHPANHQPIDYQRFKLSNPTDFKEWWSIGAWARGIMHIWLAVSSTWLYWLGILAFPVAAALWGGKILTLNATIG
jgi:hypothetical protein